MDQLAHYDSLILTLSICSRIHTLFNQKAIMLISLELHKKLLIIRLLLQPIGLFSLPRLLLGILENFSGVMTFFHGALAASLFFSGLSFGFKTVELVLFLLTQSCNRLFFLVLNIVKVLVSLLFAL